MVFNVSKVGLLELRKTLRTFLHKTGSEELRIEIFPAKTVHRLPRGERRAQFLTATFVFVYGIVHNIPSSTNYLVLPMLFPTTSALVNASSHNPTIFFFFFFVCSNVNWFSTKFSAPEHGYKLSSSLYSKK